MFPGLFGDFNTAIGARNNLIATRAPTALDDVSLGYGKGSLWFDTTTSLLWVCRANVFRSALWSTVQGGVGGVIAPGIIQLQEQQSPGTNGGTFTSGAWRVRGLNSERLDTLNRCTLTSSQFTLLAGVYDVYGWATAYQVSRHQTRLFDVDLSHVPASGSSEVAATTVQTASRLYTRETLTASKTYQLEHRCESTYATYGLGVAANFGEWEVYAEIIILVWA